MFVGIVVAVAVAVGAGPAGEQTDAVEGAAEAAQADPYGEQAALDVDAVVNDNGKGYLEARARLVAHPVVAAEALIDKLSVVPAPGPAARKRILDVLAQLGRPEHVELFADELRRAVKRAPSQRKAMEALERWRPLLVDQQAAAGPHLQRLIGDRDLPITVRSVLLDDLVETTPSAQLGDLVVLVGRGHVELRQQLRRSMARRVSRDAQARQAVLSAADAAIETSATSETKRFAALLQFRAAVTQGPDPAFVERIGAVAEDAEAPFSSRVAAVRGLARFEGEHAREALHRVAQKELARRESQAAEILSWLALQGLPAAQAGRIATTHRLVEDDAPRLATLAYDVAPLSGDWIERSRANPWPQVRQTALGRVKGPCGRDAVRTLHDIAGPLDKGGDADRQVARAAVQALGRCGPDESRRVLLDLLGDDDVDIEQRAEAARQLVRHGGPGGADAVAKALDGDVPRPLARRLAGALRFAPQPTPTVTATLCGHVGDKNEVATAAIKSLQALHPGKNPCVGNS